MQGSTTVLRAPDHDKLEIMLIPTAPPILSTKAIAKAAWVYRWRWGEFTSEVLAKAG